MTQQTGASMLARHAARMCTGFGSVPVVYGASTTRGQLDARATEAATAEGRIILKTERTLTVTAAWFDALPSFTVGAEITIDGRAYKTGQPQRYDDEALVDLPVRREAGA